MAAWSTRCRFRHFRHRVAPVNRLRLQSQPPDVYVEIPRDACGFHEFWRAEELIALGRERLEVALARWAKKNGAQLRP